MNTTQSGLNATTGITGLAASSSVYHYHLSQTFPYTIGCFRGTQGMASAVSYTTCQAAYGPNCNSWTAALHANGSAYFYDDWQVKHSPAAAPGGSQPA